MSPFKAALWIAKFAASLALFAGLAYGAFVLSLLGGAKAVHAYQDYKLTRYMRNVETCVERNGGLLEELEPYRVRAPWEKPYAGFIPKKHPEQSWSSVREYCDTIEAQ